MNHYSLSVVTEPTSEPVTLAEARAHLREPSEADNAHIQNCIKAARERAERYTGRRFMPTVLRLTADRFPCQEIKLPGGALNSSTTVSVQYLAGDGTLTTLSSTAYDVDTYSEPARISPKWGTYWPQYRCQNNAVRVQYTAGYTDASAVPAGIKSAILLLVGSLYEHREDQNPGNITRLPLSCEELLKSYQVGDEFIQYAGVDD